MSDVFLSSGSEDRLLASRYADALEREGFRVWWESFAPGDDFALAIEKAVTQAKAVVVLWSKNSVDSGSVQTEASLANRFGKLASVLTEPCSPPSVFQLIQGEDLDGWSGNPSDPRWRAFVGGLKRRVHGPESPDPVPMP